MLFQIYLGFYSFHYKLIRQDHWYISNPKISNISEKEYEFLINTEAERYSRQLQNTMYYILMQ